MKGRLKKTLALTLSGAMMIGSLTMLTGCGSSGSSSSADATSFSFLLNGDDGKSFYTGNAQNPAAIYWKNMEWDADGDGETVKLDIEITELPTGTESDTMNTIMATGEYGDLIDLGYVSDSAATLYGNGIILDLTDLVDQYMPNYKAWMESHPDYADRLYTNVDGEDKIISLYQVNDVSPDEWCGYEYRRDWIVKYGTNPETGESFTGGWEGDEYVDDVVFPSGETYPKTITDWEWMFEIFDRAIDEQGIDGGYAFALCSAGMIELGDLVSGFGMGSPMYSIQDGECVFGADTDQFRTYIECMNTWYENGWIKKDFDEEVGTMFWSVDNENVYSGKVGCWYGMNSSLGNKLDTNDGNEVLEGIAVFAAPTPINDKYGDESCRNKTPNTMFTNSHMVGEAYAITEKAADKDLASLLTAIDYLYSEEGGRLISCGLSEEQADSDEEIRAIYDKMGLTGGAYTIEEYDGEEWLVNVPEYKGNQDVENACRFMRMTGLGIHDNRDEGDGTFLSSQYKVWSTYDKTGNIGSEITSQLTQDQADETSLNTTNIRTYNNSAIPDFITGRTDIYDDAAWQAYCDEVNAYNPQVYCEYINAIIK